MKIYQFKRIQFLPITVEEAWNFFSNPENLSAITPAHIQFRILYISGEKKGIYPGQLIRYKIKVVPWMWSNWLTEITHVNMPHAFIDEQRYGPYALWHHQHFFKKVPGGTEMTDEVNYAIPYGLIGRFANWLFVERNLKTIFDYRYSVLEKLFAKNELVVKRSA